MSRHNLHTDSSTLLEERMKIRKKSEMYRKRNEQVGLPNLITREVYQVRDEEVEELTVEIICNPYTNIKLIEYCTIKRVLNDMGERSQRLKRVLKEAYQI